LAGATLSTAVAANRVLARALGWACVIGGHIMPGPQVLALLGLGAGASEEDVARAIAEWQRAQFGRPGDGQIGPATWERMLRALRASGAFPTPRFKEGTWNVFAGGRQIGVIEKTRAYTTHQNTVAAGVTIEFGFRVTNMEAVTRARFVDADGEPAFRWIQIFELRTVFGNADPSGFFDPFGNPFPHDTEDRIQDLRRAGSGSILDPSPPLLSGDEHPYYWDDGAENESHRNAFGTNRLCYTTLFSDRPTMPLAAARPGRRAYFNFETALVGVILPHRNVILNTMRWGFDIIRTGGGVTLGVNPLSAGPTGGSPAMRNILSREIGHFHDHCFVGGGFTGAATCT
jgi:hypothetical protein